MKMDSPRACGSPCLGVISDALAEYLVHFGRWFEPNLIGPFWALIGPFWALIGIWGGVAQMESEFKTRRPKLATFGQIIYYVSSRILENHNVESRKDLIT